MKILGRRYHYDFDAKTQEPCRGREKQRARRDLESDLESIEEAREGLDDFYLNPDYSESGIQVLQPLEDD